MKKYFTVLLDLYFSTLPIECFSESSRLPQLILKMDT
jgi:hypothetical protein